MLKRKPDPFLLLLAVLVVGVVLSVFWLQAPAPEVEHEAAANSAQLRLGAR